METIQIAPHWEECTVEGGRITGTLGARIFHYDLPEGFCFSESTADRFKQDFCAAIALCSKQWQITNLLNSHFGIEGGRFWEE